MSRWFFPLFLALFCAQASTCPVARAETSGNDAAFTSYEQMVESAFPDSVLMKSYSKPSRAELALLESIRAATIQLMENAGQAWLSPLVDGVANTRHVQAVKSVLRKTPVWLCEGECKGCIDYTSRSPGIAGSAGCAKTSVRGEFVASIIVIRKCLLLPGGCGRGSSGTQLLLAMKTALTEVAYYKLNGASPKERAQKRITASLRSLERSSSMLKSLMVACPGPFPDTGRRFLRENGHLKPLGTFANRCGKAMLAPLAAGALPGNCQALIDPEKKKTWLKKVSASRSSGGALPVERCDSFCEWITCGEKKSPEPRWIPFQRQWSLSLPEGACEGAKPVKARAFVRGVLTGWLRDEWKSRDSASSLVDGCAKRLVPKEDEAYSSEPDLE